MVITSGNLARPLVQILLCISVSSFLSSGKSSTPGTSEFSGRRADGDPLGFRTCLGTSVGGQKELLASVVLSNVV
jgi:hypothetical protein